MNGFEFDPNWPAPAPFLHELGRIMALWGSLESTVNFAISKLAGYEVPMDYRAIILTAHSNFQQKIDVIAALSEQLASEYPHLAEYKVVMAKIRDAQKERNKYAHNGIIMNEDTGNVETSRATARGTLKTTVETVTLDDLVKVSKSIHEAIILLHNLITNNSQQPLWERNA